MRALDLFCGAGGWSEGAARAGIRTIGLDTDADACRSSRAAGHDVVRADVSRYPPKAFAPVEGIIASPPCTAFSMAGKGKGRDEADRLHAAVEACRGGYVPPEGPWEDDTAPLVLEVLHWTDALRPTWIACEQVPPVLGLWEHMADVLRGWGYSARARKLCAADWGVPQTRRRAFLLAHRDRLCWPEPTHAEHPEPGLFGARESWVTMAEALGWHPGRMALDRRVGGFAADAKAIGDDRPAPTLCLSNGREVFTLRGNNSVAGEGRAERDEDEPALTVGSRTDLWELQRPATTVQNTGRVGRPGHKDWEDGEPQFEEDARPITIEEAAVLQGLPPDYPFRGSRTSRFRQIGNAVPPPWAQAILGALL